MKTIIETVNEKKSGVVIVNKKNNTAVYSDYKNYISEDITNLTFDEFLSLFPMIEESKVSVDVFKENLEAVVVIGELAHTEEECRIISRLFEAVQIKPNNRVISALVGILHRDEIYHGIPEKIKKVDKIPNSASTVLKNKFPFIKQPIDNLGSGLARRRNDSMIINSNLSSSTADSRSSSSQPTKKHKLKNLLVIGGGGSTIIAVSALVILMASMMNTISEEFVTENLFAAAEAYEKGEFDNAERHYKSVLKEDPSNITALNGQGYSLINKEEYGEASDVFDEVIALNPDNLAANLGKTEALVVTEEYAEAIKHIAGISDHKVKDIVSDTFSGRISHIEAYKDKLNDDDESNDIIAYSGMGDIHNQMGSYSKAIEYFDKALSINEKDPVPLVGTGDAHLQENRLGEAEYFFNLALQYDSKHCNAVVAQANYLAKKEQYDDALENYKKAITIGKSNLLEAKQQYEETSEIYKKIKSETNTCIFNSHVGQVNIYIQLKLPNEAQNILTDKLNDVNNPRVLLSMAQLSIDAGNYDAALANYDKILKTKPLHVDALLAKGDVLLEQDKYGEALDLYNKVLKVEPPNLKALQGKITASEKMIESNSNQI